MTLQPTLVVPSVSLMPSLPFHLSLLVLLSQVNIKKCDYRGSQIRLLHLDSDTFASKTAAIGDDTADASVGNVTGSNAVNVFLGIGVAWTFAAFYWAGQEDGPGGLEVKEGTLTFSVVVFCVEAMCAIAVLLFRRRYGGELGGPRGLKVASSLFFVFLWVFYLGISTAKAYCVM